jgi:hypothetical protein
LRGLDDGMRDALLVFMTPAELQERTLTFAIAVCRFV